MLTGYADVQSILGAVNEGAVYKFITKPWNDEDLRLSVSLALQQYVLLQENRRLREISKRQQGKIKNYAALFDEHRAVAGNILLRSGVVRKEDLDEATFARYLVLADAPDPDLYIRTGGEVRISNFLLWQAAYSELVFTDCLWPDFGEHELDAAIGEFAQRERRFGLVKHTPVAAAAVGG